MKSIKMDWLRMEARLREVLRKVSRNEVSYTEALIRIDAILGSETGRGYELDYVALASRGVRPVKEEL